MAAMVQRTCSRSACGKTFTARTADVKRGWAKFCSKSCKASQQEARTGQYSALKARQDDDFEWGHPFASGYEGHGQS